MFRRFFVIFSVLAVLVGCQSIVPKSFTMLKEEACLDASSSAESSRFVAYGSGVSLERATRSAQGVLAQQISSTVSSEVRSATRVKGEVAEFEGSVVTELVAENIPLDQHRIEQTCQASGTYYVRVSLEKSALVKSSQVRLMGQQRAIRRVLQQAKSKSDYERYLVREQLQRQLVKLMLFDTLLLQYADRHDRRSTERVAEGAHRFIADNRHLRISLIVPKSLRSLLPPIEHALRRAELEYGLGLSRAAAEIRIKGRPEYRKTPTGRYVTHVDARLEVRRTDTGELLASLRLGKKSGESSQSRGTALEIALKKHSQSLRRKLHGDKTAIRKVLGIVKT